MAPSQSTWNPQPSTLDKKIDSKRVDCTYDCICIGLTAQFTAWFPQLNETGRGLILLGSSAGNIIVISCGHTTDFYPGKTDLPKAISSKISRGKFISGFVLPR